MPQICEHRSGLTLKRSLNTHVLPSISSAQTMGLESLPFAAVHESLPGCVYRKPYPGFLSEELAELAR